MNIASCRICNNACDNTSYIAREMMMGYRDRFEYFKCARCGCLQIKEIPENLSKYYPDGYYSFGKQDYSKPGLFKAFRRHERAKNWLYERNIIGMSLSMGRKMPYYFDWFKKARIRFDSEILDIGCGAGQLLLELQKYGFSNLTGTDLFIEDDIFYKNRVKVLKKPLADLKGQFDFIMLHNSFEHMPQPLSTLKELCRLLKTNRHALIRTPIVSSFAWRKYGVDWVQLDAPRHLFLHTIESIQMLAGQAGFEITDIVFDSTEFQFLGSEQYSNNIPLRDSKSYCVDPQGSIFSKEQITAFKNKAVELNKDKDGDSACFYLYKNGEEKR